MANIVKFLDRLEEGIIAFLLAAMSLVTFLQVVMRYVFNSGLSWGLEATTYMFGWLIFIGIAYGVKIGSHIGVDVLVRALPPRGRHYVGLFAVAFSMFYAALMFYGGYVYVSKMHSIGVEAEDIEIERWILLLIVPIGLGLMFVRLAQNGWRILRGEQEGLKLADEAKEAIDAFRETGGGEAPR